VYFGSYNGQSLCDSGMALISAMVGRTDCPKIVHANIAPSACDVYPIPTSFASMINLENNSTCAAISSDVASIRRSTRVEWDEGGVEKETISTWSRGTQHRLKQPRGGTKRRPPARQQ
jgi:predicted dehydrogenase